MLFPVKTDRQTDSLLKSIFVHITANIHDKKYIKT